MRRQLLALGVISITLTAAGTAAAEARAGDAPAPDKPTSWRAGSVSIGTGFSRSDGSERVRETQRGLRVLGYRPGRTDGLFGPATEAAVRRFQSKHGLGVDGVVGRETLVELRRASAPPSSSDEGITRRAARSTAAGSALDRSGPVLRGTGFRRASGSERVRKVQGKLRRLGYPVGRIDGRFGPITDGAVRRFQRRQGLEPDGIVGPTTVSNLDERVARGGERSGSNTRPERRDAVQAVGAGPPQNGDRAPSDAAGALPVPPLLVALMVNLALLVIAIVAAWRRRRRAAAPIHRHLHVQGRSGNEEVGEFAGPVILVSRQSRAREPSYLVNDPAKPAPVWVRVSELDRVSWASSSRPSVGRRPPLSSSDGDGGREPERPRRRQRRGVSTRGGGDRVEN